MVSFNYNFIFCFILLHLKIIECDKNRRVEFVVSSCHTDTAWTRSSRASDVLRSWIQSITVPARKAKSGDLKLLQSNWIKGRYDDDKPALQSLLSKNFVWMRKWPNVDNVLEGWHYVK